MSANPQRPDAGDNQLAITFFYYRDLPAAMRFYEEVLGLTLAIEQGWSKIYKITDNGFVGLVDETRGSHRAHPVKPVQLCIRVADVAAWYAWIATQKVEGLGPQTSAELGDQGLRLQRSRRLPDRDPVGRLSTFGSSRALMQATFAGARPALPR